MANINHFEVISKYDSYYDMLGIKITDKYTYDQSVEIVDGVIIDFNTENKPVALQIIGASELFKVPKSALHDIPSVDMKIKIDENSICLDLTIRVHVHDKRFEQSFNSLTANN